MGIVNVFRGLNTLGKATKFLKQQDEIKDQARNLAEQIKSVIKKKKKFLNDLEYVFTRLKDVINK